jgi:MinD-like ATPase involved in chromosome partitioning or flagellar assembly/antitoxin component HigA of HigAB toxin-antitoxin module
MHAITFYSFKGGVGRTLALVNVAVELAKAGRKVLMVDFDLEAPGIHTFDALRSHDPHSGVVEYVTDYIATGSAPDVRDYVYEPETLAPSLGTGRIWVMPAGRGGDEYRKRLASINWQELYRDREGYLFIEDLKCQLQESFVPDYVLIDSRTGHTDIEGICTRQLPDAVVVLFFPNEQNLAGLSEVISDIKAEENKSRLHACPIKLTFVMSNVPELDDEDGILRRRVQDFRKALNTRNILTIHNYPSLALLNQTIFTLERSKSRLAKEYRRLKDELVDQNAEDSEGVIRFLKRLNSSDTLMRSSVGSAEERLQVIQEKHRKNGEVLFRLGITRKNQARFQEAISLFDKAIEAKYELPSVFLERATCYSMLNKGLEAAHDLKLAVNAPGLDGFELLRLIDLLGKHCSDLLPVVPGSPSYSVLDPSEKLLVLRALSQYDANIMPDRSLLQDIVNAPEIPGRIRADVVTDLLLAFVRDSRFRDAISLFHQLLPKNDQFKINDYFNFAMAQWAENGRVPLDTFVKVVELDDAEPETKYLGANFNQCLAVALWAIGRIDEATQRLAKAEELAKTSIGPSDKEFSCWRYKNATREEFLADCQAIRAMIHGGDERPSFLLSSKETVP